MVIKNLDKTGLGRVWANIKSYISSKLPTDYINGLSVSGKVITYTKADGTNGTITTQDTNTTYSNMSQTEADTGTATTARSISAKVLNTKIENKLADYALSSDIPTKTSELTNDSGFLTSHQSLVNYVTTNTEQTITGNKLFKGYLRLIQSDLGSLGTAPTSNKYQAVNFYETTNTQRHAMLEYCYRTTGQNDIKIAIYNPQKTTDFASLVVGYDPKGVAFTKAVTPPDTSNSADIATTKWVVNKGYVDLDSAQTLTEVKKLPSGSALYSSTLVKGTLPTSTQYINFALSGSNAYTGTVHRIGLLETSINASGEVRTYMGSYLFKSGVNTASLLGVCYPLNSTPYAFAPNPDDGTADQKVATTNWVESKKYLTSHQSLSNYVTLNSAQTISGAKTLTAIVYTQPSTTSGDAHHQHLMYTDTEKGTLPTRNYYKHVEVVDSTKTSTIAHRLSAMLVGALTNGNTYAQLEVYKTKEAGSTRTSLGIRYDYAKDTWVTYSPTPPATDNSTQIATTAWVNAKKYISQSNLEIMGVGTVAMLYCKSTVLTKSTGYYSLPFATSVAGTNLYCVYFRTSGGSDTQLANSSNSTGSTEVGYQYMHTNGTVSGTWKYIGNTIRISALQPICGLFVRIA